MRTIDVPDDTFSRITIAAHALGTTVGEFAVRTLDHAAVPAATPSRVLAGTEWLQRFEAHMHAVQARAERDPPGFDPDVSREGMYAGCGE